MNNYPLGNFLVQIKNAHLPGKSVIVTPYSKIKEEVARVLVDSGFLATVVVKKQKEKSFSDLEVGLISKKEKPFWDLKLYSKPGRRYYAKAGEIPYPSTSKGLVVISTPRGIMRGSQARKQNLGGEVIALIW
ncbi:30S ribosomal protein S8 [Candidatus Shapirobacteria bacterium]|nr:30S ribosomal protein S8 [Candidatus Shapirobacteria bacterium]